RQVLLPALNKSIDRLKSVLKTAGDWIVEKVGAVTSQVGGFISGIQGNSYLSAVYPLIKWIPTAIDSLKDWATDKVTGIVAYLQEGVDHLKAFFEPILKLLEKLVTVVGNLLGHLPDLILGVPFALMPKCIKDPIIKWLTEVVLKQIPVISEFISLTEKWEDIKTAALTVLKQVFVDGQLAKGVWTYFKTLLTILGIDPQLVTKVVAKAAQNFSAIITKPGAFLKNIWTAIKGGFSLFFQNIWTHLPQGALDWLFGEVKGAVKVAPPKPFTAGGILGYVMELFGITKENVYKRMSDNPRIGPKKVEMIRKIEKTLTGVLEWISVWIKEGPEGLLKKIKKEVGDLKDMVINGVVSWITKSIVAEITKRLMTSADPLGIGATLNTIKLIYDTMKTAVAYINRMLNLVNSVMDSIADIISGNTKGASVYLEGVLAKAVPFVVGFAVEVIIGPIGEKIKEIVGGVRKKVDDGIDFLINGALDFIGALVVTAKGVIEGVKKLLGLDKPFTAVDGSPHHLYYASVGGKEQLMVASNPSSIDELLKNLSTPVKASTDIGIQAAYISAGQRNGKIKTYEGQLAALPETPSPARQLAYDNLNQEMQHMTKDLEKLMVITAGPKPPDAILPAFVSGVKAGGFEALYISASTIGGEEARKNNGSTLPGWNALLAHKDPADPSKNIRERDNYEKMHLLHSELGGKASDSNLTPMKSSYNTNFNLKVEAQAVQDKPSKVLWYKVQIDFHPSTGTGSTVVSGIDYSAYPSSFNGKYGYMEFDNASNQWRKANAGNPLKEFGASQVPMPDFSGGAREYDMNTIGDITIASMTDGINPMPTSYANIIALERREAHDTGRHRKFDSFPDLTRRLDARQTIRPASGFATGRAILDYLKSQNKLKFN
ncbi:MAG: DNA/RNA non-specific endonuclease, partial [Chitinophagaceae bacterium]